VACTDPGTAAPIEWVDGSTPDLTDHEKTLDRNSYAEGYADGERHGYRVGGEEAMRAMTTFTTMLNDRRVMQALELLHWFTTRERDT
jgi:flagellar biosynthesis/type III secretory pathway protein FliH